MITVNHKDVNAVISELEKSMLTFELTRELKEKDKVSGRLNYIQESNVVLSIPIEADDLQEFENIAYSLIEAEKYGSPINSVQDKDVNEVITELENSIDNLKVYSADLGAVQIAVERIAAKMDQSLEEGFFDHCIMAKSAFEELQNDMRVVERALKGVNVDIQRTTKEMLQEIR